MAAAAPPVRPRGLYFESRDGGNANAEVHHEGGQAFPVNEDYSLLYFPDVLAGLTTPPPPKQRALASREGHGRDQNRRVAFPASRCSWSTLLLCTFPTWEPILK